MNTPLSYVVGSTVMLHDRPCIIAAQTDIDQVLVRYQDDGRTEAVNIVNLKPLIKAISSKPKALDAYHEKDLEVARERFSAIEPLLCIVGNRGSAVRARAQELGLHLSTLYRWLAA